MTQYAPRLMVLGIVIALGFVAQAGVDTDTANVAGAVIKAVYCPA